MNGEVLSHIDLAQKRWAGRVRYANRSAGWDMFAALTAARAEIVRLSEQGSCWEEGPTMLVPPGECAPIPPRCVLTAGHKGAHRGDRHGIGGATEWMTRAARSESHDAENGHA